MMKNYYDDYNFKIEHENDGYVVYARITGYLYENEGFMDDFLPIGVFLYETSAIAFKKKVEKKTAAYVKELAREYKTVNNNVETNKYYG